MFKIKSSDYKIYSKFIENLAKKLNKFYYLKLNKPFKVSNSKANKTSTNIKQTNRKVIRAIKNLNPKNTFKLTRAFTHFINFINLAELIDTSRSLNEYENSKKKIANNNLFIEEIFEDLFNSKNLSEKQLEYAANDVLYLILVS